MRTPGRCTNMEGCWISASHRDVWISIGEAFTCPNCQSVLTPPPARAVSFRGLRRAAATGVAISMGLAAVGVGAVKLSSSAWTGQHSAVAMLQAPSRAIHNAIFGTGTETRLAAVIPGTTGGKGMPAAARSMGAARTESVAAVALAPARNAVAVSRVNAPVLLFAAVPDRQPSHEASARTAHAAAEAPVPAAFVTLISQAAFVVPPSRQRPVILPISFGRPVAPEDAAPPVSLRWRHHGFGRAQPSGFLPGPVSEAVAEAGTGATVIR